MKKSKFIYLLIFGLSFKLHAQITILQEDFAPNGSYLISAIDTQNLDSISLGLSGPNQTWDFSKLSNTTVDTVKILDPNQTPFDSAFPQANTVVQQFGGFYYYLKATTGGLEAIGVGGSIPVSIINDTITTSSNLNPPYTYLIYPSSYQTQYSNESSFEFNVPLNFNMPVPNIGTVKVVGAKWSRLTNKKVLFDGWGETQTPLGKFKTIREKNQEKRTESTEIRYIIPFLLDTAWYKISDTVYTTVNYNYWAKEVGYSLVQIETDTTGKIQQASYLFAEPKAIAGPVANFNADTTMIYTNDTVYFKDLSLGDSLNWVWDFGDSTTASSLQSPYHIYSDTGLFSVSLIVSNINGLDTLIRTNFIRVALPPVEADFIYSTNGLTVSFTNTSKNTIPTSKYFWDLGDSIAKPTKKDPVYSYQQAGTYIVQLIVINEGFSSDTVTKNITVVEILPVIADFTYTINELMVSFTDVSKNTINESKFFWDLGDSIGKLTTKNPVYKYTKAGTYKVQLIVLNEGFSSDTINKIISVISSLEEELYKHNFNIYPNPSITDIFIENISNQPEIFNFKLFNLQGKEIINHSDLYISPNQKKVIPIENLSDGLYFYTLKPSHQKNPIRGKIIKL